MADEWIQPFSPTIMKTRLPRRLHRHALAVTEALLGDEEACKRYAEPSPLLYNITKRLQIPRRRLFDETGLGQWLEDVSTRYGRKVLSTRDPFEYVAPFDPSRARARLAATWVNEQRKGDFVPVHMHPCDLVCVAYLKMPALLNREAGKGGMIEFICSSPREWAQERLCLKPAAGDVVVFPGWLLHTVYPFSCDGERRVMPSNVMMTLE